MTEITLIKLLMQHSDFKDAQLNIQYLHTFTLYILYLSKVWNNSYFFHVINVLK